MATGFGFCNSCGSAVTGPGEKFCSSCGAALPVHAPAPTPAPPPYAPVAPVQPYWAMQPATAPYAPARATVNPFLLIAGVVLIAALVGAGAFLFVNLPKGSGGSSNGTTAAGSASPSGGSGGYPGSIVFSPSTVGCDEPLTTTMTLPSSVKDTDQITGRFDGKAGTTQTVVDAGMTQREDGSWFLSKTNPADCSFGIGLHTAQLADASGKVLAEGSYTLVESASAKPTQKPTPTRAPLTEPIGTIEPSSISCSAAAGVQVVATYRLPASVADSILLTAVWDDEEMEIGKVSSFFVRQSDGTWLATSTFTGAEICDTFDPGEHRMGYLDYDGRLVVEVRFTIKP